MTARRALILAELRASARDATMRFNVVFFLAIAAAGPPALYELRRQQDETSEEGSSEQESSEDDAPCARLPPVAVTGAWPADLPWPEPFVPEAAATIEVRPGTPPTLSTAHDRVADCLDTQLDDARAAWLRRWGLTLDPVPTVRLAGPVTPRPELDPTDLPWTGPMALLMAGVTAAGLAADLVPRARSTGLLEQLRATQTRGAELLQAWAIAILTLTLLLTAAVCATALVSAAWWTGERPPGLHTMVHALPFAALLTATALRASLPAADVVAANLRSSIPLVLTFAGAAMAAAWLDRPWLAALVPFGGPALASAGLLGPWAWLADAAALAGAALTLAHSGRALDREETAAAGSDPTLLRRARGDWLPEALTLGAMGFAAGVANSLAGPDDLWLGWTFGFGTFMLLPALLTARVLGLPSVLPLGRPTPRDLALALPLTAGLLPVAAALSVISAWLLPENLWTGLIERMFADLLTSPWRVLALALYPAICEELLYRGAIFGLLLRGRSVGSALVLQAALFALAHGAAQRLLWTFTFGLLTGWLRLRTGSLWAGMWVHLLFNGAAGGLMYASVDVEAPAAWMALGLLGLVVLPWVGRPAHANSV
jgi:membrane protease YdiL (CAAX protease family)